MTPTNYWKKPDKYSLDGKTLLHSTSYDINEEADRIWKGSSNKKYWIITVISSISDMPKCIWSWKNGVCTYLVTAISFLIEDTKVFWKLYIVAKVYAYHKYAIFFISKVDFTKVIAFSNTPQMYLYTGTFLQGDMVW